MLIEIIIASISVFITVFGALKKNRVLFNTGYFVFGILVVVSELRFYAAEANLLNLANAFLWGIQASLAIPNKLPYDGSKLAKSAAIKVYTCLALVNLYGFILAQNTPEIPEMASYFHLLLAILPVIPIALVLGDKLEITAE